MVEEPRWLHVVIVARCATCHTPVDQKNKLRKTGFSNMDINKTEQNILYIYYIFLGGGGFAYCPANKLFLFIKFNPRNPKVLPWFPSDPRQHAGDPCDKEWSPLGQVLLHYIPSAISGGIWTLIRAKYHDTIHLTFSKNTPVSDLFLTFPGVFFNFKQISTGSQTRNNFSDRQSNII